MNRYLQKIKDIAIESKYTRWYIAICSNKLEGIRVLEYTEKHHILPKCFKLGGESDIDNLVKLTPREHFLVHWLLTKMFTHKRQMAQTYRALTMFFKNNENQNRKLTSLEYEMMRKRAVEANKIFNMGSKRNNATRLLMSTNNKSHLDSTKTNIKFTKLSRYGDANYNNKEKSRNTCLEKYGSSTPAGSIDVQLKMKNTKLEKYGDANYNNTEKQQSTNIEKYGTSVKANSLITCPDCNHTTTLMWFNRKHKDGKCLIK